MSKSTTRPMITVVAVLLLASIIAAVPVEASGPRAPSARAEHDRIVSFWTKARVARAVPRDFVYDSASRSYKPAAAAAGGATTTIGSSWLGGGEVLKATGKVLFAMGTSYFVCSASVADDTVTGRSIILTAGHCAYDEVTRRFATNWMFVPDYDSAPVSLNTSGTFCASTSLGCWTASSLVVHSGFATAGSFNTQATLHDFAFAVVGAGGKSRTAQLDTTVGGHPIQFSSIAGGTDTHLFGYPAAGRYKGKDLVYCRGPLGFDTLASSLTYRVSCNMTGGSSGGPWLAPFSGGSGTLVSVNSYGYSGITAMHGPKLNAKTEALFTAAGTAAGNTIVS